MANEEQLAILEQGVEVWNRWRAENRRVSLDLSEAILNRRALHGADFYAADLWNAQLDEANLNGANLRRADLRGAHLREAILTEANLIGVDLRGADLSEARLELVNLRFAELSEAYFNEAVLDIVDLSQAQLNGTQLHKARLTYANLHEAYLVGADLSEADLSYVNLSEARLSQTKFSKARMAYVTFAFNNLSGTVGLEDVVHTGPSSITTDTFDLSNGKIPEIFLRGCGLSDWEIASVELYDPDLGNEEINRILYKMYDLRASQALQISPLFISYSHADVRFVDKLEDHLNEKGIRFWRDVHDMKSGRIETQVDRAIHQNPTVLLILSEHSLKSDWVEHEVHTARELEKEMGRDVLCPVALDDSWKDSPWPKRVMEQVKEYNILDFSAWQDDSKFGSTFNKLIDGLELFYKG